MRVAGLRAIRARALCVLALALAGGVALAVASAGGSAQAARTSGTSYAVAINVPGAQASGTGTSPAGSYQYRDLVSVQAYEAGSALSGERAYAHADLTGVSLLAGLVTATSIGSRAFADGRTDQATGTFGGAVQGLLVAGAPVALGPGGQFTIPGVGTGTVSERRVLRSGGAYRGSEVALRIRLTVDWHALPAGTEVVLGFAQAAAAGDGGVGKANPDRPGAPPVPPGARGGASTTDPSQLGAPVVPIPEGDGTPTEAGAGPTGIEAPPPGGFTLTPPIDASRDEQLSGSSYVFPVAGGALYGHDYGNARSDTGFHQGSDLFAPEGTPLVAVQDGTLRNVGWNRLGGWRLWIEDVNGNWFYYAHLSAFAPIAVENARVHAGDVVGFVGHTGDARTTPPHLHFEIHPAGRWSVPPWEYLQTWQGHGAPPAATSEPPPVSAAQLESTDISAASGLDTGAVGVVAAGGAADSGVVALGVPAPTAAELLAASGP